MRSTNFPRMRTMPSASPTASCNLRVRHTPTSSAPTRICLNSVPP